jgi:hypothetical protein
LFSVHILPPTHTPQATGSPPPTGAQKQEVLFAVGSRVTLSFMERSARSPAIERSFNPCADDGVAMQTISARHTMLRREIMTRLQAAARLRLP